MVREVLHVMVFFLTIIVFIACCFLFVGCSHTGLPKDRPSIYVDHTYRKMGVRYFEVVLFNPLTVDLEGQIDCGELNQYLASSKYVRIPAGKERCFKFSMPMATSGPDGRVTYTCKYKLNPVK